MILYSLIEPNQSDKTIHRIIFEQCKIPRNIFVDWKIGSVLNKQLVKFDWSSEIDLGENESNKYLSVFGLCPVFVVSIQNHVLDQKLVLKRSGWFLMLFSMIPFSLL